MQVGAGDALAAGFLFGWCSARNVRRGLLYGCVMCVWCGGREVPKHMSSVPEIHWQRLRVCVSPRLGWQTAEGRTHMPTCVFAHLQEHFDKVLLP